MKNKSKCTFVGHELTSLEARLGRRYSGSAASSIRFLLQNPSDLRCWFVNLINTGVELGRSRSCDLVLVDSTVSGKHAMLLREGEQVRLRDLGSTNGCFVNQVRVTDQIVNHGDELRLGGAALIFYVDSLPPVEQGGPADASNTLVQFDVDRYTEVFTPKGTLAGPYYHVQIKACRKAAENGLGYLVIDLADVQAVSDNAFRALAGLRKELAESGGELMLCSISARVRDTLVESGTMEDFDDVIFSDSAAARAFIIRCMTSPGRLSR